MDSARLQKMRAVTGKVLGGNRREVCVFVRTHSSSSNHEFTYLLFEIVAFTHPPRNNFQNHSKVHMLASDFSTNHNSFI